MTTMCTVEAGCPESPVATYTWPWGEHGLCCVRHQVILAQKAQQLRQQVHIVPLRPGEPTPMAHDERVNLNAQILSLRAELEEARTRGLDLYHDVETLQAQVRTLTAQKAALDGENKTAATRNSELLAQVASIRSQAAKYSEELQRLQALVKRETPTSPENLDPTPVL